MNVSPQQHFERTGWWARAGVMLVILVAIGAVLALNAERLYTASLIVKGAVAFAALILLAWPGAIFGELMAEILRECTTARCSKCGGTSKAFAVSAAAAEAPAKPHYACQTCGHVDPIVVPKAGFSFEFNNSHDGLGGGGG